MGRNDRALGLKRFVVLAASLWLAACGFGAASRPSNEGRFVAQYGPATEDLAEFRQGLVDHRWLDTIAIRLNDSLKLPKDIVLATGHCAEPNAEYEPDAHRVIVCYELFSYLGDQFKSDPAEEYLVSGTVVFALMHELGHALVDVLALPITGREEDAVDQLATILLLEQGPVGDSLAFGAVGWLSTNAQSRRLDDLAFADDHGLDQQRVFNLVCWIYGRDSTRYHQAIEDGWLPEQRRAKCPHEYRQMTGSWRRLLDPFRRQ